MKLPLSLVIITLNEERNIQRCIQSVPFASEIVILDSGSQDQTLTIAKQLGAEVHSHSWQGFGVARAKVTELAKNDWILALDADEALSKELAEEILKKWSSIDETTGYEMPRKSFHLGQWIEHGGWYPDAQLRLFNRKHSAWRVLPIHERVQSPKTVRLKNPILHWVFKNLSHQVLTNDRYSTLQAEMQRAEGVKFCYIKWLCKPIIKFVECYVFKMGFLDGRAGFIIAVSAGYSVFLRWSKIWELEGKTK